MEIKINKKFFYKNRIVIVVQISEKRHRVEVTDDLSTMKNPFWIDLDDLKEIDNN